MMTKKNFVLVAALVSLISCSKNENVSVIQDDVFEVTESDSKTDVIGKDPLKKEEKTGQTGKIIENNSEIISEPLGDSALLGMLHVGDFVEVVDFFKEGIKDDNSERCWYKIKTRAGIIGWVPGENIVLRSKAVPDEFKDGSWKNSYGSLPGLKNIEGNDLFACSWHRFFTVLTFSEQGHYAIGDYWSGADFGSYTVENNTVLFSPPLIVNRFDEYYRVDKLYYSNDLYYHGSPVLTTDDETVLFYANGAKTPDPGLTVKINQQYCEIIDESTTIKDRVLFCLPDKESKNLFQDNYYGEKIGEAKIKKLAKTEKDGILWYYVFVDFTGDDPSDGGGPYYFGWVPDEYLMSP
jgi:hypothetical protein